MDYITIKGTAVSSLTEKKSEFIGSLAHVDTEEEAIAHIERIKAENRKARHNVYAYILREGNMSRYSDDGEPQGTAGQPVLEVLKGRKLTDCCLVVTRYFGGILLGTGGLVRAYSGTASLTCDSAETVQMCECREMSFSCDYSLYGIIQGLLAEPYIKLTATDFEDNVRIRLMCRIGYAENFAERLTDLSNGRINAVTGGTIYTDFSCQ